jgi:hypothetical protein
MIGQPYIQLMLQMYMIVHIRAMITQTQVTQLEVIHHQIIQAQAIQLPLDQLIQAQVIQVQAIQLLLSQVIQAQLILAQAIQLLLGQVIQAQVIQTQAIQHQTQVIQAHPGQVIQTIRLRYITILKVLVEVVVCILSSMPYQVVAKAVI